MHQFHDNNYIIGQL